MQKIENFTNIPGVEFYTLTRNVDERGWLSEIYRDDELPPNFKPAMAYISETVAKSSRGPHEHLKQTDGFVFIDGIYILHLWDNRMGNEPIHEQFRIGWERPVFVVVPPGVIHGYINIGNDDAFVINLPNALYKGEGKTGAVDEVRYEGDSRLVMSTEFSFSSAHQPNMSWRS